MSINCEFASVKPIGFKKSHHVYPNTKIVFVIQTQKGPVVSLLCDRNPAAIRHLINSVFILGYYLKMNIPFLNFQFFGIS